MNHPGVQKERNWEHRHIYFMFPNLREQFWYVSFLFQHDWTQSIRTRMRGFSAEELDWPPHSPDLHSREHLWDELKQRLRARTHHPKSVTWTHRWLLEEHSHKHTPKSCGMPSQKTLQTLQMENPMSLKFTRVEMQTSQAFGNIVSGNTINAAQLEQNYTWFPASSSTAGMEPPSFLSRTLPAFLLTQSSCSLLNVTFLTSHLIKSWIIEYVANMSNDESGGLKKENGYAKKTRLEGKQDRNKSQKEWDEVGREEIRKNNMWEKR